jgi:hypothetical protein
LALKMMRLITQPYMENGEQVYAPGDLLEMDAPAELGGRIVVVDDGDGGGVAEEAQASVAATVPASAPAPAAAKPPVAATMSPVPKQPDSPAKK